MEHPEPIPLEEIRAARERIAGVAMRTPLVPLGREQGGPEIFLKLENLQPIGSFKIRGAANAILSTPTEELAAGVYTASAGNMGQGVAWVARKFGFPARVVVPDHAPKTKLDAIERLGATIVKVPFDRWWRVIVEHELEGMEGKFIHPVSNGAVIAGNGTIGLEILEDLPEVDTIVVPYGGGGLSCGIASAVKALKANTKVFAAEVATAAPFAASLEKGEPVEIDYQASFVDGIGGKSVLPEMWPLASSILDGSLVVSVAEIASAIRLMIERNRVVAEGAGAASVAAAVAGRAGVGKIVCVVSGGNIDGSKIRQILAGEVP